MNKISTRQVIDTLWEVTHEIPSAMLYAILDSARNKTIYPQLLKSGEAYNCLYRGNIPAGMTAVAPYIVEFQSGGGFLEYVVENGWGDNWGIFFASSAFLKDLETHFREFVLACDEKSRVFYFRFYDPRVFRVYLLTCNPQELNSFFGEVGVYMVEDETPDGLLRYSDKSGMLYMEKRLIGNGPLSGNSSFEDSAPLTMDQ